MEQETLYRHSGELNELFAALAKAQSEFESAPKAGANPHFKSRYATLESVLDATKAGRQNNGLAVIQMPGNSNGTNIAVTTILGHSSGQWIESTFAVAPSKFDAQGAGSVVTYLRRYALMSVLGIAPQDDDGEAAVAAPTRPPTSAAPNATSAAPSRTPSSTGETKGRHPKWDYAGARFREIEKAMKEANAEKSIHDIIDVNEKDLDLIKELHPPSHQRLIALRDEMLAKLQPPRADTGMVSELLGEP